MVGAADDSPAATMAAAQRVRFGLLARVEAIKLAEARAAAARARALAAREHAAHVAHQKHQTQLAAVVTQQAVRQQPSQQQTQQPVSAASGSPQQIAEGMLGQFGWSGQFSCLDSLWNVESGWNPTAENPNSGAYGIPQALPGSKMASAGPDWQTNPATQILWGLQYIQSTYGSPCAAWSHEEATGWY
jgi:Transglycosylase SLT domain